MRFHFWLPVSLGIVLAGFCFSAVVFAADPPAPLGGLAAALTDGGSSSRASRQQAIEALPLERMPDPDRRAIEKALRSTTLYRRLPVETFTCDADLLNFAIEHPESVVDIWRVLGISRLALDPAGPRQWRLADGYGTVGMLRVLHRDRRGRGGLLVVHGRGAYTGPLSPKPLTGTCLLILQHRPAGAAAADGRAQQTVQIDAFVDVDGMGLEIVTRTLQPLVVRSAASNLHEICLFMATLSEAATNNPEGVVKLSTRLARTDPEDRQSLAKIARAAGSKGRNSEDPAAAERLQTELAARWLPAEDLDQIHRQ
jgi:hypothetical protein